MTSTARTVFPFLLIDAGNSRIKWALTEADSVHFAQQGAFAHPHMGSVLPLPAEPDWSNLPPPGGVWISNVAGERCAQRLQDLIRAYWPDVAHHTVRARAHQCGVKNGYRDVQQLGSDRWAGLIGARAEWPEEAVLIASLGTALTLDLLDATGYFVGGLIAPGRHLMMRALGQHTALLPTALENKDECAGYEHARSRVWFATDTQSALHKGCQLAQAALIEHTWHAACQQLNRSVRCILSGGGAARMRPLLTIKTAVCEHLALSGLAQIAQQRA